MAIDRWAKDEAERLLGAMDDRWRHVEAVARLANQASGVVGEAERPVLVAAAWLHDVGDAPSLRRTGLQALDGALWLREQGQERIAGLVAYHSGAEAEAELLGLAEELRAFTDERSAVTDSLWYCDLTTGPDGERMTLAERLADVEDRHGRDSVVARGMRQSWDQLEACVQRVERRLKASETISR